MTFINLTEESLVKGQVGARKHFFFVTNGLKSANMERVKPTPTLGYLTKHKDNKDNKDNKDANESNSQSVVRQTGRGG